MNKPRKKLNRDSEFGYTCDDSASANLLFYDVSSPTKDMPHAKSISSLLHILFLCIYQASNYLSISKILLVFFKALRKELLISIEFQL